MNGIELLHSFSKINFHVIFTTGFNQYAVLAFRISAVVDYLLKPVRNDDLKEAIRRINEKETFIFSKKHLEVLTENLVSPRKIALRASQGLDYLNFENIVYCKSDGNYISVTLSDGTKKTYSTFTLKWIEDRLPSNNFCRINQSYLVNLKKITGFIRGDRIVHLDTGESLSVSITGRSLLLSKLGNGY